MEEQGDFLEALALAFGLKMSCTFIFKVQLQVHLKCHAL